MECSFPFQHGGFFVIASALGSLPAALAEIPDPRGRKGLRHPLAALMAATVCGLLTGARGFEAIAAWVRGQPPWIWHLLGFKRRPACANCYRELLAQISPEVLESVVQEWVAELLPDTPLTGPSQAVAMDGKTLCGTLAKHGRSVHLLSLFDHATGFTLRQLQMPSETNEHKAALALLKKIAWKGRTLTADAIFCQRDLCQQVVEAEGDYLITVKNNQPELREAIEAEFRPGFSPLHRA
jgi:hypothetical protein